MSGGRTIASERLDGHFDQVLAAARTGAGWAGERLWRSLAPAVASYLRVQGATEPDDLTSEVFIGVLRGLASFEGTEEQFRSWVFTIAHRRLTDERRRWRPRFDTDSATDQLQAPTSVEHEALDRLGRDWVDQICRQLVPDQRDVLLLRLVAGLTVDEVAAVVGKSPGAVKALQRRGLEAVRKILERRGVTL